MVNWDRATMSYVSVYSKIFMYSKILLFKRTLILPLQTCFFEKIHLLLILLFKINLKFKQWFSNYFQLFPYFYNLIC